MSFLSRIQDLGLDFLFPKSLRMLELEALSPEKLTRILPRAEDVRDENTIALFDYQNKVAKRLVWEVKYHGNTKIAENLGVILYENIQAELEDLSLYDNWRNPILIPIPISAERRAERGWNQAELLSEAILKQDSENLFTYIPRVLSKIQHTESQVRSGSRSERLKNLKNSMEVTRPELFYGKCVVVIDDVITTGATFIEARRALGSAGVKKILCVSIAH